MYGRRRYGTGMRQGENDELLPAVRVLAELEREARDRLIQSRDLLHDRDERFAVLEADLWAKFEEHERRNREEVARLARENAALREELVRSEGKAAGVQQEVVRLRVRLDRILQSPPIRLYGKLARLPGLRALKARRANAYNEALRSHLHR
jgi:hypothetical protein